MIAISRTFALMPEKKQKVQSMFDNIAPKYDFLNHFLSGGIDRSWRKRVVKEILKKFGREVTAIKVLDVASGTGDLALAIAGLKPASITGIDIAEGMLAIGREKVAARGLSALITLEPGDAEHIPMPDNTFDVVTVAFGVRNYEDLPKGLSEMHRVLKPGGIMLVLEFSQPENTLFKSLYTLYSKYFIPAAGKMISRDSSAYTYLPESVAAFPSGKDFLKIYREAGLVNTEQIRLTMGIASIYKGEKALPLPPQV
jgi:demethylmenaquinone methyltransferase / 2-methoxy-6-polyprenyl-1,4-benzoquinol methylase